MKYEFYCDSNEKNKMNLIINLNKIVSDIKRGEKAFNNNDLEIKYLKNDLGQKSLFNNEKDTKIIVKKAKLKELEDKKEEFLNAIFDLYDKYSKIAVELEEKFKLKQDANFYIYGINLFEHVKDFKIIKVDN